MGNCNCSGAFQRKNNMVTIISSKIKSDLKTIENKETREGKEEKTERGQTGKKLHFIYMPSLVNDSFFKDDFGVLSDNIIRVVIFGPHEAGKITLALSLTKAKINNFSNSSFFSNVFKSYILYKNNHYNFEFVIPHNGEFLESNCYFVLFDLSNYKSFISAKEIIKKNFINIAKPLYLLGNKCELEHDVNNNLIQSFTEENKLQYFEISAINEIGLSYLMEDIKKRILN